jgi:hypothetical protein
VELFSIILLVALFSLTIEIPGFLLNSRYDRTTINAIDALGDALLNLRLDPSAGTEPLERMLNVHKDKLEDLGLAAMLVKLAIFFKQMGNVDNSMLEMALSEIRRSRAQVESRSKHPLPVLAQFLGLSGLTFVLGEILAALRAK